MRPQLNLSFSNFQDKISPFYLHSSERHRPQMTEIIADMKTRDKHLHDMQTKKNHKLVYQLLQFSQGILY